LGITNINPLPTEFEAGGFYLKSIKQGADQVAPSKTGQFSAFHKGCGVVGDSEAQCRTEFQIYSGAHPLLPTVYESSGRGCIYHLQGNQVRGFYVEQELTFVG